MKFDPQKHHRHSIRLPEYDYAQAGAYFITVCTWERKCTFGEIVNGEMRLSNIGLVVDECWKEIPKHFPNAKLDSFVVMPNHVHGIVFIMDIVVMDVMKDVGATHASPLRKTDVVLQRPLGPKSRSLGAIIGSFKSATSKLINQLQGTSELPVWQRNYYEHVIRNERSLNTIRLYIQTNPLMWSYDIDNPNMSYTTLKVINRLLSQRYGFTDEESDFIINYDIKHRMEKEENRGFLRLEGSRKGARYVLP